jgi:hypothetical protein
MVPDGSAYLAAVGCDGTVNVLRSDTAGNFGSNWTRSTGAVRMTGSSVSITGGPPPDCLH